jgi:hypothetical protein
LAYAYAKLVFGFNKDPSPENYKYWLSQPSCPHIVVILTVILLYFFLFFAVISTQNVCYTEPRFQAHVCMMYMYSLCIHKPVFLCPLFFIFTKYSLYCFYKYGCHYFEFVYNLEGRQLSNWKLGVILDHPGDSSMQEFMECTTTNHSPFLYEWQINVILINVTMSTISQYPQSQHL